MDHHQTDARQSIRDQPATKNVVIFWNKSGQIKREPVKAPSENFGLKLLRS
tara:strand:- start:184 stop:336 length:153 start_codon:yes stop_codon:yes gene_type:complete